jgi:hypothetical protein
MLRPSAVDVTHRAPHSSDLTPQHDELLRKLDSAAREAIAKWRESGGKPISVEGTHSPTVSEAWHRLLFKRKWRISAVRIDSGDLSIVIVGDRSPEHDNLVAVFDAILSKLLGKLSSAPTSFVPLLRLTEAPQIRRLLHGPASFLQGVESSTFYRSLPAVP